MASVSNIDPTVLDSSGDLILLVGEGALRIQVSSHVLSLASKVFKAMFKPHSQEGNRLKVAQGSSVCISLPEDDPEVTSLACQVLHHQVDHTAEPPSLVLLSKLATFCDKYDCICSIRPSVRLWIQRHQIEAPLSRRENILTLSYMFDDAELFSAVTAELVLKYEGSFIERTSKTGWNTLPATLYCDLYRLRIMQLQQNRSNFSQ